jgi:hypothetical protein
MRSPHDASNEFSTASMDGEDASNSKSISCTPRGFSGIPRVEARHTEGRRNEQGIPIVVLAQSPKRPTNPPAKKKREMIMDVVNFFEGIATALTQPPQALGDCCSSEHDRYPLPFHTHAHSKTLTRKICNIALAIFSMFTFTPGEDVFECVYEHCPC